MTSKIVKRYKGGCYLLLVCPDEGLGLSTPDNSSDGPEDEMDDDEKRDDSRFPGITIDANPNVNIRGRTGRTKIVIPEPVWTTTPAPERDTTVHKAPNKISQYVTLPSATALGSRIDLPGVVDRVSSTFPTVAAQPVASTGTGGRSATIKSTVQNDFWGTSPDVNVKGVKLPSINVTAGITRGSNVATKAVGLRGLGLAAAGALTAADYADWMIDHRDQIKDAYDFGVTSYNYLKSVADQYHDVGESGYNAIKQGDLIGLGEVGLSLTPVPAIVKAMDRSSRLKMQHVDGVETNELASIASQGSLGQYQVVVDGLSSITDTLGDAVDVLAGSASEGFDNLVNALGSVFSL